MEQIFFLNSDEESEEVLSQVQRSLAQRLVLVAPVPIDHLRLNMLLRLVRRYAAGRDQQICLVSADHLLRVLAERMGYTVAETLDTHHGLTPANAPSIQTSIHPPSVMPFPASRSVPLPPEQRSPAKTQKPGARLEALLIDGFLSNPAATPTLEEEERAEHEEPARLHYEIADETYRSQAQQEAEEHEARIIATILQTSTHDRAYAPMLAPASITNQETQQAKHNAPPHAESDERDEGDTSPASSVPGEEVSKTTWKGRLRPMHTLEELLAERGQTDIFEWFAHQAANQHSGQQNVDSRFDQEIRPASSINASNAAQASTRPTLPGRSPVQRFARQTTPHQPGHPKSAFPASFPGDPAKLHPGRPTLLQRLAIVMALALSFLMACIGFSLIPSAQVSYRITITPYSETIVLEAQPQGFNQPSSSPHTPLVSAEIARFDGVLAAMAPASGRRPIPGSMQKSLAFPTQGDIDHLVSLLRTQLLALGKRALQAQKEPGDLLGQAVASESVTSSPPVDSTLPEGAAYFQVSLALHLRATLVRHQALVQAVQNQMNQDISQMKRGEVLADGQPPTLNSITIEPLGTDATGLAFLVRVLASETIGPGLTPEQARATLAGMTIADADAYLRSMPGITNVSITIQPTWLNRLPIYSARIRINLERQGAYATHRA